MTNAEKVGEYLKKAEMFFVATEDGDKPKVRPFSFYTIFEDKIYFGVGTFKDCYKQIIANPNVEISASNGKGFLRYYGKAIFVENQALLDQAFAEAPYLPKMYNETTGNKLGMFYLADATAEFRSLFEIEESLSM
ncbi:pyridoxamine 5'-phosphate oxidase family protein [Konateibacter massiliensis]|uniref:pyridoxamine 5'-phosphate oxidase family protein n=1 Tax=Konateibacter massiliensis TaxID=2002841 RepID=UPI000C152D6D|nr:pyridoxamine 5'-phosphate oxidase family protein [Konateibacter massiliensis]